MSYAILASNNMITCLCLLVYNIESFLHLWHDAILLIVYNNFDVFFNGLQIHTEKFIKYFGL